MRGLRAARQAAGLSLEQLGVKAGISGGTVGRIELGLHSPRLDTMEAIADALDLSVADLLQEPTPAAR